MRRRGFSNNATCKNSGCNYKDVGNSLTLHETQCQFNTYSCPAFKCNDKVTLKCMKDHLTTIHSSLIRSTNTFEYILINFKNKYDSGAYDNNVLYAPFLSAYGEFFRLQFTLPKNTDVMRWEVSYINIRLPKKYHFVLKFHSSDTNHSGNCIPFYRFTFYDIGNNFMLAKDVISFCTLTGDLYVTITIFEGNKPATNNCNRSASFRPFK